MIAVPRRLVLALVAVCAVYVLAFAAAVLARGASGPAGALAVAAFTAGLAAGLPGRSVGTLPAWRAVVVVAAAAALPALGAVGLDPARDSYSSGAWYVVAVGCLALLLLWRRRAALGWAVVGLLVLHTWVWSGLRGLAAFGVLADVLLLAVLAAGGWALKRSAQDLERYTAAQREALEWRAAQDAYEAVRQHRLRETSRIGGAMLQRIATGVGLDAVERAEARVLEQTIRDEIRGRRLLDDGVRAQVLRLRRRGAAVQVNDDGGLDDLPADDLAALLAQVAEALAGVDSDRVIIRTAPRESPLALTVVAMSVDPIAAALGMDDEDEQVDLWLELPMPVPAPELG